MIDVTSAIRSLYLIAHPDAVLDGDAVCALCGGPSREQWSSAAVMADTFTRYDTFRRPDSPWCCNACSWYLDARGQRTGGDIHPQFSRMSYIVLPERWLSIEREHLRYLLRHWNPGPPTPIYLILSRVKKKHLALLARPWMPGTWFTAQFEEERVSLPRAELEALRRLIGRLLHEGVGKTAIASGILPPAALLRHPDPARVIALNEALSRWRPSPALEFALWIARSPEREEVVIGRRPDPVPQPRARAGGAPVAVRLPLD